MPGLGLVPPVVEREIDGRRGSLQIRVTRTNLRFVRQYPPQQPGRASLDVHVVRLLDYLIFNTDRHLRNLFFDEEWCPVVIDHSMAFHPFTTPSRPLYRFPREPVARLRALDRQQLERALGRYLQDGQIDALEARRRVVLEMVDRGPRRVRTRRHVLPLEPVTGGPIRQFLHNTREFTSWLTSRRLPGSSPAFFGPSLRSAGSTSGLRCP